MASGGYNASYDESPTGFGSENMDESSSSDRGGVSSAPIVGIDLKRNEDLKKMLDSNKDSQKLDAMKLVIGMVAKGRDCSNLFPAVVKNVVSKNPEIKKLVFVYLVRYAEEQQDLALLSISTFQKALKDPNQLIRGSALRVLSSIRVPIIAPIMMLSIKDCVTDMSPYVRKTAANAIPKLYNMDPEQKEPLVEVIEKLLKDQTTLVAGSVVMAFEIVCPERIDLIHKNYRKLCNILVDVDEWGQVVILNMLTRYARTQFIDPNKTVMSDEKFYDSDDDEESSSDGSDEDDDEDGEDGEGKKKKKKKEKKVYVMDADHRLLLRVTKPLLQSRSAAVVMAVAQMYHHIAPRNEISIIARPLIRLLKGSYEVQSVVLSNIATLSAERHSMFEPYLKSFFVRADDPTHVKLLKLDIMANIAGETSIHNILKEFRAYISSADKQFAAATIQAIGRVACNISEVTETCLHGLTNLLSHKNETVVAECIVVIKKLLQLQPKENQDLIKMVARLTDKVTVASAKASILWLVGEYCSLVPKIAPDVLRKAAKNFVNEEDSVKLQVLNLAAKLIVSNPKQTKLLCQYIMNLAKYDQNYDIRDRARFLRKLVLQEGEEESALGKYAKKILMASKPVPVLESNFKSRAKWQLGSLSHYVNSESKGYQSLPDFPEEPPDPTVRNVEDDSFFGRKKGPGDKKKSFFDDSEESESEEEFYSSISGSDETGTDSDEESGEEETDSEEESEEESEEDDEEDEVTSSDDGDALENLRKRYLKNKKEESEEEETDSDEEETDSEEETTESEEESESEEEVMRPKQPQKTKPSPKVTAKQSKKPSKNDPVSLIDLADWDATPTTTSNQSPPMANKDLLKPLSTDMSALSLSNGTTSTTHNISSALPVTVSENTKELLNRMSSEGLTVKYRFLRKSFIASDKMVAVELTFENTTQSTMSNITVGSAQLQSGMKMNATVSISQLTAGGTMTSTIGIDFNDTLQPAKFKISVGASRQYSVSIDPMVGEIIEAARVSETTFNSLQSKLTGMHESTARLSTDVPLPSIKNDILKAINVRPVDSSDEDQLKFAALTFSAKLPLLVSIRSVGDNSILVTVNCEKMVFGATVSRLIKEIINNPS